MMAAGIMIAAGAAIAALGFILLPGDPNDGARLGPALGLFTLGLVIALAGVAWL